MVGINEVVNLCERCIELIEDYTGLMKREELFFGAILHAIHRSEERIVGVLEDLQAADAALTASNANLAQKVVDLANEQSTFLSDVAARLAGTTDPAAIAAVAADLTAQATNLDSQAQQIQQLIDAQTAADPGPTPATTEPTPAEPAPATDAPPVDMANAAGNASSTPSE